METLNKIDIIVGARPNFMKAGPLLRLARDRFRLVHTGQHYDFDMSDVFFQDLQLPSPDSFLACKGGTQARTVADIMVRYEDLVLSERPAATMVVGDVNSTLAAALVSAKLGIPVIHLEAGLRSGDRAMPEEINRLMTDSISDLLLTPSPDGDANLQKEGVPQEKIVRVGNIMIDALQSMKRELSEETEAGIRKSYDAESPYILITLHRPSNVDDPTRLLEVLRVIVDACDPQVRLLFPIHPRTRKQLEGNSEWSALKDRFQSLGPLRYRDFVVLQTHASVVVTDSGGVQEETTALQVPCITVRTTTERPITIDEGTNVLVGDDREALKKAVQQALSGEWKAGQIPDRWDGHTAERILPLLEKYLEA